MEQTRLVNLPIIGRVQHGEKIDNKVKEYGYFIAKTQDAYMQSYVEKFDNLVKGKQSIDIEFFSENPLSKKYVRYNQSGEVCRCPQGSNQATQRVKNGWQQIECKGAECEYRQKDTLGKCACNRIGWLKFLIPSVSTDRIFLMKITGQTSISKLDDYIKLQKAQGKSIKGHYTLFLKQIEQANSLGKTFNNYVLDILKKEDFNSSKPIPQTTQNQNKLSTTNAQNVNNQVEQQELDQNTVNNTVVPSISQSPKQDLTSEKIQDNRTVVEETKVSTKKTAKRKSKKEDSKEQEKSEKTANDTTEMNLDNCYTLLRTFSKNILNKGQQKEYFMGEFADMKDTVSEIAIKPEYVEELSQCDLGTVVRLDVQDVGSTKFAVKLEFIQKALKKIAA